MIVKRPQGSTGKAAAGSRRIVRRNASAVGAARPAAVVRRPRGVQGGGGGAGGRLTALQPSRGKAMLLAGLAAVLLVAAGGVWLYQSPHVQVQRVAVEGNERVPADLIVERAGVLGANMFSVDLASAEGEVGTMPLVKSVSIERRWPSKLVVKVEERKPWGEWEQGGVRYTIDREGFVLGSFDIPSEMPVIRSSETTSLRQGDRVNYQAIDATAALYEQLPRELGVTLEEVAFVAGKGVQVRTTDGQTALLGDASSIAYKISVWKALAAEAKKQRINYTLIDLRYGNRPVLQ